MEGGSIVVKRQLAVAYVGVDKILFYVKGAKNSLQLNLPSDVVSDLEIIGREKFDELVDTFFQMKSLRDIGFDIILVFSQGTTFEKDFVDETAKVNYEETQKFLDMVPFEEVLSNIYKINKKNKVVALNRELYEILLLALERNKAYVSLVLPMTVLAETSPEFTKSLDLALIAARADSLKRYGFVDIIEGGIEREQINSIGIKKKDVRLYLLVLVFVVLLTVLIVFGYTTFFTSPKINKKPVVLPRVSVTPTVIKEIIPSASESGEISTPSSFFKLTPSATPSAKPL